MVEKRIGKSYGLSNPLQDVFPIPITAQRAPTVRDLGFKAGQIWIDLPNEVVYTFVRVVSGEAFWVVITNSSISPFIVSPLGRTGDFTTIQSAIDAAVATGGDGATVYVLPGTYTEDLDFSGTTVLTRGITLEGATATGNRKEIQIIGTHTPPISGRLALSHFTLVGTAAIFSSTAAGSARLTVTDSNFNVTNGHAFDVLNWTGTIESIHNITTVGDDGFLNNSGGSNVTLQDTTVGRGGSNTFSISGILNARDTNIECLVEFLSGGVTGIVRSVHFGTTITFSAAGSAGLFEQCIFNGFGSVPIIYNSASALFLNHCTINTQGVLAIDGTGAFLELTGTAFLQGFGIAVGITNVTGRKMQSGSYAAELYEVQAGAPTDFAGSTTLSAGTVTIANTDIRITDTVLVMRVTPNASSAIGHFTVSVIDLTSFTITAVRAASPGSTETNDVSSVRYFIVREF